MVKSMKDNKRSSLNYEELSEMYPLFPSTYDYLSKKHKKVELSLSETLQEIQMSAAHFYNKKKEGKGIPDYRQKDKRSKIYFPIICVALFLSEDFRKVD